MKTNTQLKRIVSDHRHVYFVRLPSGAIGRLCLRLPAPGTTETHTMRWSRMPSAQDFGAYEAAKQLIAADLQRVTGLLHTVRDVHPLPYQREEACRG